MKLLLVLALLPLALHPAHAAEDPAPARCVLLGHDLDHSHYACVDPRDPSCPVHLLRTSGGSSWKTCLGP